MRLLPFVIASVACAATVTGVASAQSAPELTCLVAMEGEIPRMAILA